MCSSPGVIINRKHGKLTDFLLRFTPLRLRDKKSREVLERLNFMATENCCGELVLCRLTGEDNLFYRVMFQCPQILLWVVLDLLEPSSHPFLSMLE